MNSPKLTENNSSSPPALAPSSSPMADSKFFDGDSVFRKALTFTKATTSSFITTTSSAVNVVIDSSVETLSSSPLPSSPPPSAASATSSSSPAANTGTAGSFEVSSILPASFGATASSVFNKINPFDFNSSESNNNANTSSSNSSEQPSEHNHTSTTNSSNSNNKDLRNNPQKEKQTLFSSKFNFASLSITSGPIFNLLDAEEGKARHLQRTKSNKYENRSHQASNMMTINSSSRRTNSESASASSNNNNSTASAANTTTSPNSSSILSPSGSIKRHKLKPAGTLDYQVLNGDTIEKIALKWNSTPTNILHLNSMATRTIFPGQTLYVPDPDYVPPPVTTPPSTPMSSTAPTPLTVINEVNASEKHDSSESLFSSSQSNVSNSFNFFKWRTGSSSAKPGHVELQQTPESINNSKSHHHHHHHHHNHHQHHHSLSANEEHKHQMLTSRHTLSEEEAKQLDEECMQRFLKINCKIVTRSKGCYDGVLIITPSALMFDPFDVNAAAAANSESSDASKHVKAANVGNNSTIYDEASAIIPIELISNVIMYEDLALKDVQEYFDFQQNQSIITDNDAEEENLEGSATFELGESKTKVEEQSTTTTTSVAERRTSSSVGDKNENNSVFESTEKPDYERKKSLLTDALSELSVSSSNQTSESATTTTTTTPTTTSTPKSDLKAQGDAAISCYLCIKVNTSRDFLTCPLDRRLKNKLKSEFWFQVYDNSRYKTTDKICAFFLEWKNDSFHEHSNTKGHFQLVKQDEKLTDLIAGNLLGPTKGLNKSFSSTNRLLNRGNTFVKDWEIVNLHEFEHKLKTEIEIEKEYKMLPTLMDQSIVLKDEHLRKLNVNLIPRAMGYNWVLSFSTEKHGFSLNTIYRNLADVESPCLVVVMDTNLNVFGAMVSGKLVPSEHFYGTGESFLYTFYPSFKVFKWTGENNFFTKGNSEGVYFGAGEGLHGLWFDGDLLNGHTQKSKTFDNELLTSAEFFQIKSLEVWTFSDE